MLGIDGKTSFKKSACRACLVSSKISPNNHINATSMARKASVLVSNFAPSFAPVAA